LYGIAVAAVLIFPIGPAAASARVCATAQIDESFVLPDGSMHEPGTLKLCRGTDYNPAISFHSSFVDNMAVGMLLGRSSASEDAGSEQPFLVFFRNDLGQLRLFGYALPGQDGMERFRLEMLRGGKDSRVITTTLTAARAPLPALDDLRAEPVITIVANLN
jgi:hypothetical protein